jgi:hypothetical protein
MQTTATPRPMNAMARKPYCQPRRAAIVGSVAAPRMPLTLIAVWLTPIAVARSRSGNQSMTALTAEGKMQPAPMLESARSRSSDGYDPAKKSSETEAEAMSVPLTSMRRTPTRSTSQPAMTRLGA